MSLVINSGYKSLNLYFNQPVNSYYIDDITTSGSQQLQDDSVRTDIDNLAIWLSDEPFSVDLSQPKLKLVYAGVFQSSIVLDRINTSSDPEIPVYEPLLDNTQYYLRYAITSKIDPTQIVPTTTEFTGTTLDSSDGKLKDWIVKTANYTAVAGDRIIADTRNGSFTITLPANPTNGASVTITDGWDFSQNNLIVARNGSLILNELGVGEDSDINLDVQNTTYEFIYTAADPQAIETRGTWIFTSTVGPKGDEGNDARLIELKYSAKEFVFENDATLNAATPESIVITAIVQNLDGAGAVSFTASAYDVSNILLGSVILEGTGNTRTLTPINFNTVAGVQDRLSIRYVVITASIISQTLNETFSDSVTINRIDNGSDAIVHQMSNENHTVVASTLGVVSSYSGAFTLGTVRRGAINETMNWTIVKEDSTGITTQLTQPQKISTTGNIGNIATIAGGWTASITGLDSITGLAVNDTISVIESKDGRLFGGTPTSVTIQSINSVQKSLVYKVLGGTTPIAGGIGGLAKGVNNYTLTTTNLSDNIDSATSTVIATKDNVSIPKTFSLSKSKEGTVFAELDLSNDNINVVTKNDGTQGDYTLVTTNVTMKVGVINVLPYVNSITITPSSGVTFSYTKNGQTVVNNTTVTTISTSPQINTLSLAVTNLTADNGKLTVTVTYLSVNYTSEFTVSKNKQGPNGEPATVYSLEASSELIYNPNTESFSPSEIVFTTYSTTGTDLKQQYTGNDTKIRLEYSENNLNNSYQVLGTTAQESVNIRTLTTSNIPKNSRYLRYSLFKIVNSQEILLDREIDVIGTDGTNSSTIVVDVENDTHQIPFDTAGNNVSYAYSGTKIQVFDNNTPLRYTSNATQAGYWSFQSVTGKDITPGAYAAVSGDPYTSEVANHTNMLADTASITYTIKAISLKGVTVTSLLGNQTFTKVIRTAIFRLKGVGSITKSKLGTYNSITISGQKIEGTTVTDNYGAISYRFLPDGLATSKIAGAVTITPTSNSTVTSVNVKLYNSVNDTEILDEANIAVTQDGLDAHTITTDVINDTHFIPVDSSGSNPNMLYSGTEIYVFNNTEKMQYTTNITLSDNQWRITQITGENITPATIPGSTSGNEFVATILDHAGMGASDTGRVNYIIQAKPTGKDVVSGISGSQTFTKVKRTAIYRIINAQTIVVKSNGTITQAIVNAQKIDGTTVTNNFGYITLTNDSGSEGSKTQVTATGITTAATISTKKVIAKLYETNQAGAQVLDTAEILVVNDGEQGIDGLGSLIINYSNDVHLVPITGTINWTGSGGVVEVYENGTKLILNSNSKSNDFPTNSGRYNLYVTYNSGNVLTQGNLAGAGTQQATLNDWAGTLNTVTSYRITAYIRTLTGKNVTISTDASIVPSSDPSAYRLVVNPGVLAKSPSSNTYTPSSINVKFYKAQGSSTPVLDNTSVNNIRIAYATDTAGTSFSNESIYYTSIANIGTETGYSWDIPTTVAITAIRVRAYNSSSILLDEERIPVTVAAKGDKGDPGASVDTIVVTPATANFIKAGSSYSPANIILNASTNFIAERISWSISGSGTLQSDPTASTTVNRITPSGTGAAIVTVRAWRSNADYSNGLTASAQTQAVFGILENGIDGGTGKRVASGYVYYTTPQDTPPPPPSPLTGLPAANYDFNQAKMLDLNTGWSINAPVFEATTTARKYWAASFSAVESGPNTGTTKLSGGYPASPPTFTIQQALGFTGIVTFSSYLTPGQTTIDGSKLTTGTVKADSITTTLLNSIKAEIGTIEVGSSISSRDFDGVINSNGIITGNGTKGWAIGRGTSSSDSGNAVFNKVTVRGDISCDSITINNVTTTTGVSTSQIGLGAVSNIVYTSYSGYRQLTHFNDNTTFGYLWPANTRCLALETLQVVPTSTASKILINWSMQYYSYKNETNIIEVWRLVNVNGTWIKTRLQFYGALDDINSTLTPDTPYRIQGQEIGAGSLVDASPVAGFINYYSLIAGNLDSAYTPFVGNAFMSLTELKR